MLALLLILVAGVGCRVGQYLSNRSFWIDESFIVLNLRSRTAAQLLGPLDYTQAAPPLFLLAERAVVVSLGSSEYALRLLPLLAGVASLGLMAAVARRVLDPPAALAAVALFAFSDRMIWHATEVKPYSTDVMAGLLLTFAALAGAGAGAGRASATARLARTAALAAVLAWLSYPSVFVFGGVSLALLPAVTGARPLAKGWWRGAARYVALNVPVVVSFVLVVLLVVRKQQTEKLNAYWAADDFANLTGPLAFLVWLARKLLALCNYATDLLGPAILLLAVVGAVALARARGRRQLLAALTLPVALVVLAACARRYPFDGERVSAFLVPGVLLLAAAGFGAALKGLAARYGGGGPSRARRWQATAAAALLAVPAGMCAYHLVLPRTRAHVRPAAEYVAAHWRPGDVIYCDPNVHQFLCYWPPAGAPDAARPDAPWAQSPPRGVKLLKDGEKPAGRFWLVLSYAPGHERQVGERAKPARAAGTVRDEFRGYGGSAFLFDPKAAQNGP